ncbi:MAG: hypoxanthine phosphoribosyltransferase [Phycisphaeraceae bacterium]|nr:hypoxanthine phosphoribosyltransferase [Phycisphaeraceae bacterium]
MSSNPATATLARMKQDIREVLIGRGAIADRIRALADQIAADLAGLGDNAEITIIPILTGSFIFVADLIRELPLKMQIRLISVSSYPGMSTTSKGARLSEQLNQLPTSLTGRHVLIVDDILDSGQTLRLVTDVIQRLEPASVRTCVLLRKQRPEIKHFPVNYVCFDIPDEFVVGFGLDYNDYYRNLPDIVALRSEVLETETVS